MKKILKKYCIKPSKRLGQNFLIDKNVLKKIIEAAELSPNDTVLEIGPGLGILTLELARLVKKVIAVEKDKKMCDILLEILDVRNVGNVEIVNQDALKFNPCILYPKSYILVANLPYYITSPVIRKFLECNEARPRYMILMVQKEVAQRIVAKPPHMNLLAVAVQFYAQPEIIGYVSRNSFWPQPKVDSAIIKIVPKTKKQLRSEILSSRFPRPAQRAGLRDSPSLLRSRSETMPARAHNPLEDNIPDPTFFFKLVKTGFSSKRKMLKNNLKIDESIFKKIGLSPKIRAENLTINDWLKLYNENL